MPHPPRFDLQRALDYISGLTPPPVTLAVTAADLPGVLTRPPLDPLSVGLLENFVRARRPSRVLEVGASLGQTALALGRILRESGGKLTTIEIVPEIAGAARENVRAAGLADVVEVVLGDANAVLPDLAGPFGLILQDSEKDDYLPQLDRLAGLLETGGWLVTDDVLFPVIDLPETARHWQPVVDAYNRALRRRTDLDTVWLPLGYGIAVSVKL
ncbi:MAG: O-methyltransferase [Candidatus Zixiibacteriota bacterium]|nr:MAG: O-methyltransferase [candidate division Zixibacteria bacterium]